MGDNLERFATSRFNDPRPPWFYLPIVAGGLLPWTPLMLCGAAPLKDWVTRRWQPSAVTVRLLLWAMLPLAFFTVSIGKQPRYILPILPPLALLLARTLIRRLRSGDGWRDPLVRAGAASIGMLIVVLGTLLMRALPLIVMIAPALVIASAGGMIAAGLAVTALALFGPLRHVGLGVGLAGAVTLAGLQYGLSPAGRDPVQDMAALVVQHRHPGEPIATYRVFVRNLVFYTGIKQDDLSSADEVRSYLRAARPVLVVIAADQLEKIATIGGSPSARARTGPLLQRVRRQAADAAPAGSGEGSRPGAAGDQSVGRELRARGQGPGLAASVYRGTADRVGPLREPLRSFRATRAPTEISCPDSESPSDRTPASHASSARSHRPTIRSR